MEYKYVKPHNKLALLQEIRSSKISDAVLYINPADTNIVIVTSKILNRYEEAILTSVVSLHNAKRPAVKDRIEDAMRFGQALTVEFATRNVLSGMNEQQILAVVMQLKDIHTLLIGGSLKTALVAIAALKPNELITEETKNYFIEKIKEYLGQ